MATKVCVAISMNIPASASLFALPAGELRANTVAHLLGLEPPAVGFMD